MTNATAANSSIKPGAKKTGLKHSPKKILIGLLVFALLIGSYFFLTKDNVPGNTLRVSGRLEGYETNVGAKIGGRVDLITVREGNKIQKGQSLAQISDDDIQAQLRAAAARKIRAEEQSDEARYQIQVLASQLNEARLRLSQSSESTPAQILQAKQTVAERESALAAAKAKYAEAQANSKLALARRDRYAFLVKRGAVSKDEYDQAITNYDTALAVVESNGAAVESAREQVRIAQAQLKQARSVRFEPPIRSAELEAIDRQLLQAKHALKAAEAEAKAAEADREQVAANIDYLKILSPIDGVVTARAVEPGAVVVPGQILLSLINLDVIYLRAYVPEGEIGKIKVSQKARVFLDSDPGKAYEGEVIEIDPEGSFTPENIYFKQDRVKQVFGIKIALYHPGGYAKPGMPADADILLNQVVK